MSPCAEDPLPSKVTALFGSVIVCALPALAIGGATAAFTVTVTVAEEVAPLLSVTFNSNWYIPFVSSFTVVETPDGLIMFSLDGPDSLLHS